MDRFFCSGSTGYLNKDSYGDLVKRDDVKAALLKALGFDKDVAALEQTIETLIVEGEALLVEPRDEGQQCRLRAVIAQAKKK